jgi:hypothetical protein
MAAAAAAAAVCVGKLTEAVTATPAKVKFQVYCQICSEHLCHTRVSALTGKVHVLILFSNGYFAALSLLSLSFSSNLIVG